MREEADQQIVSSRPTAEEGEQREDPSASAAEAILQPPTGTAQYGKLCNVCLPCLRAGRCQG